MNQADFLARLSGGDDQLAEAAVREFTSRPSVALPVLRALLSDSDPDVRWWAARALAEIRDPQVPELLRSALRDADVSVRQCAALGLREQATPRAIQDLIALLNDEDRLLARLAADALIAIGAEAVPALLEVLQNGPQTGRLEAVRALARIGDQRAIATLFTALDDPSAIVEYWADEGLERMGIGMVFFK
jgi:HEAT repeat protein